MHDKWGVTAIYAKILHDPVLQESQKKFWLFKHNFRALDLTWSDYVIVNKSTWVWELHNCQLTLITNFIKLSWKSQKRQYFCTCMGLFTCFCSLLRLKSTNCKNIAGCNIFALLQIMAIFKATFLHLSLGLGNWDLGREILSSLWSRADIGWGIDKILA